MSTHALGTSDAPPAGLRAFRYADLVLLALALPVFVLADLPLLGYGVAALIWLTQRGVQVLTTRAAKRATDPRTLVGITAASMIGRGWLVAFAVFGAGLAGESEDGLAAAVLVLALFTLYFTASAILRPFDMPPRAAARSGMDAPPPGKEPTQ